MVSSGTSMPPLAAARRATICAPETVVSESCSPTLYRQPPWRFWQVTIRPTAFLSAGPSLGQSIMP